LDTQEIVKELKAERNRPDEAIAAWMEQIPAQPQWSRTSLPVMVHQRHGNAIISLLLGASGYLR
jgi:hypothetical protein